jgi:hypothetical protein
MDHLVILLKCQPFSSFSQSFCYSVSHFAIANSTIFCTVNSVIFQLLQHLVIPHCYIAQSFFNRYSARSFFNCYSARSFFNCYSAQSFPVVTELGHFPLLQCLAIPCLLPCSVIPCCYSAQGCSGARGGRRLGPVGLRAGRTEPRGPGARSAVSGSVGWLDLGPK